MKPLERLTHRVTVQTGIYFHEADRSGHFAGWEHAELFAAEPRAAFNSLR